MIGAARSKNALIDDELPDHHVSEQSAFGLRKPVKKRPQNRGRFDPGRGKVRVKRPLFAGKIPGFQGGFQAVLEIRESRTVLQPDPEDAGMPGKRRKHPRSGDGQGENGSFRGDGPDSLEDRRKTGLLDFSKKFQRDVHIPDA